MTRGWEAIAVARAAVLAMRAMVAAAAHPGGGVAVTSVVRGALKKTGAPMEPGGQGGISSSSTRSLTTLRIMRWTARLGENSCVCLRTYGDIIVAIRFLFLFCFLARAF